MRICTYCGTEAVAGLAECPQCGKDEFREQKIQPSIHAAPPVISTQEQSGRHGWSIRERLQSGLSAFLVLTGLGMLPRLTSMMRPDAPPELEEQILPTILIGSTMFLAGVVLMVLLFVGRLNKR